MKKMLALALALMMALSLAACGGNNDKTQSGDDDTPGSQQAGQNTSDKGGENGGGAEAFAAAKRLISEIDMYGTPKDDGRSGEFFSIELDADNKALGAYMCFVFDTEENAAAFAENTITYGSQSYIVGKVYFGHWKDLSGKSRDEAIEYMESNDGFRSSVDLELDISEAIPYEIDESFFTDTDTKGVVDLGDHYQVCYHDGDTITGVEDWYKLEDGVSGPEMISKLIAKHDEDNYITQIYQNRTYVVAEYSVKKYYTGETWEQVKEMYESDSGAEQPDDEGGETAPPAETTPSGDVMTVAEFLEFYGLSEDDCKPEHFTEFGELKLEGKAGEVGSMGAVGILVNREQTTDEAITAWCGQIYDKLEGLSEDGKLYNDIHFSKELTGLDALIKKNIIWDEVPGFSCCYPYALSKGKVLVQASVSYDREDGRYGLLLWAVGYLQ